MNKNTGHGHVIPRPDGDKARCGGPALCSICAEEVKVLQNKFIEIYAKPKLKNLLELEAQGKLLPLGKVEISVLTDWIEGLVELPHNFSVPLPLFQQYLDDFVNVQQLATEQSRKTFEIFDNPLRIKCKLCNRTSYGREDVRQKYCVGCDYFHDDPKSISRKVSIDLSVGEVYMLLTLVKKAQKDGDMEAWSNVNRILEKAIRA